MSEPAPSPAHIVVVDDDHEVAGIISAILRAAGYQVDEAHTGVEALAVVDLGCDLLVTDVQMPGMDGLELADRVGEHHPAVAIVMVTGNPGCDERLAEHAVLCKPFSTGELLAAVRDGLASRGR